VDRDLFAAIARALWGVNVELPIDFESFVIPKAFSRDAKPQVNTDPVMYNWKDALAPYMPAKITNIMSYRSFRWCKEGGKVMLYYKEHSRAETWLGKDGSPTEGDQDFFTRFKN
jgi:hypothetical protein